MDVSGIGYQVEVDLVDQLVRNALNATTHTAQQVITFAEILEKGVAGVGAKLGAEHQRLARGAQDATIAAYLEAIAILNTPVYRTTAVRDKNKRYAGGILLNALRDESFAYGTPEGITFANVAVLNERAKQWHRLNFGAGGAAGGGSRTFSVSWSNLAVASFGLHEDASPAFRIPRGFWLNGEGGGRAAAGTRGAEFYPIGEIPDKRLRNSRIVPDAARMTRGIRAQHWLDAGMEYIADNVTASYEKVYKEIFYEAGSGGIEDIVSTSVRPWGRHLSTRTTIS